VRLKISKDKDIVKFLALLYIFFPHDAFHIYLFSFCKIIAILCSLHKFLSKPSWHFLLAGAPGYITAALLNGCSFVDGWEQNFFISKWSMQQLVSPLPLSSYCFLLMYKNKYFLQWRNQDIWKLASELPSFHVYLSIFSILNRH